MSNEIKPCPFCGSDKSLTTEMIFPISKKQNEFDWYVICNRCSVYGPYTSSEDGAIKKWNQRPYDYDMPAIVKKVQQLEKENEQLKAMLQLGVNYERANG